MTNVTVPVLVVLIRDAGGSSRGPVVVALDGRSGCGKSTLGAALAGELDATVIRGDDFYSDVADDERRRWAPDVAVDRMFDWQRMREEAIVPLRSGRPARYRPYDWSAGSGLAAQTLDLAPAAVVIVDGVYSARPELSDVVDMTVLVDCSAPERHERLARRGHGNDEWHDVWESAEEYYFTQVRQPSAFDLSVRTD